MQSKYSSTGNFSNLLDIYIYIYIHYAIKKFSLCSEIKKSLKKLHEQSKVQDDAYSKPHLVKKRENYIFICLGIEMFMERATRSLCLWQWYLGTGKNIFSITFGHFAFCM